MFLPCPPKPAENDFENSILRHPPGGELPIERRKHSILRPKLHPEDHD
jgi:hypothetical protein